MLKKREYAVLSGFVFVLLFFVIVSVEGVSALNITLNYPDEIDVNQEFYVGLTLNGFESGDYDVKIDVLDEDEKRISKIKDPETDSWISSYYYIKKGIVSGEDSGNFILIVEQYDDVAEINVKVRNSKGGVKNFDHYKININNPDNKLSDLRPPADYVAPVVENDSEEGREDNEINTEDTSVTVISGNAIENVSTSNSEVIRLESKNIKTDVYSSSQEKVKVYSIYSFVIFVILMIAFLVLRKKTWKKYEHN